MRPSPDPRPAPDRVLGCYPAVADPLAPGDGPLLIAVCGMHGNEPAGAAAALAVLADLRASRAEARGRFVVLSGNRAACAQGVRYLDVDFNRLWSDARTARLASSVRGRPVGWDGPGGDDRRARRHRLRETVIDPALREHAEQAELFAALTSLAGTPDEPREHVAILDLHTTSAPSAPFAIALPTPRNRRLLAGVPVPLVHGLEARLGGTLSSWLAGQGHAAAAIEGGRHDAPASVDALKHALMLCLVNAGVVARRDGDGVAHRAALRAARAGRPPSVSVAYRHAVAGADGFAMRPGFASFQPVRKGDALADTRTGPVRAPLSGVLLFPLYQGLGDDGFFIARRIQTRWPLGTVGHQEGRG